MGVFVAEIIREQPVLGDGMVKKPGLDTFQAGVIHCSGAALDEVPLYQSKFRQFHNVLIGVGREFRIMDAVQKTFFPLEMCPHMSDQILQPLKHGALFRRIRQPIDEPYHFHVIRIEFIDADQPIVVPNEVITHGTYSCALLKGYEWEIITPLRPSVCRGIGALGCRTYLDLSHCLWIRGFH